MRTKSLVVYMAVTVIMFISGVADSNAQDSDPYINCGVRRVALEKLRVADERAAKQLEQLEDIAKQKPSKIYTCLPTLQKIAEGLNMTQFSFQGIAVDAIVGQLKSLACKVGDKSLEALAKSADASWDAPYGVGSVGISVVEDQGNVNFGKVASQVITNNTALKGDLTKQGSKPDVRSITDSKREEAKGANSNDDYLNDI